MRELNCFVRGQFIQELALVPRVGRRQDALEYFLERLLVVTAAAG